jgi:hypothetical protein
MDYLPLSEKRRPGKRPGMGAIVTALVFSAAMAWARYQDAPSPLADEHLIILRPGVFQTANGQLAPQTPEEGAVFSNTAVRVSAPVAAPVNVRFSGRYELWIRVGQKAGDRLPLTAELMRGDRSLLRGALHDGEGSVERGGVAAYAAYVKEALKYAPPGAAVADAAVAAEYHQQQMTGGRPADESDTTGAELASELIENLRKPSGAAWVNVQRIDPQTAAHFAWWRIGAADLAPGDYALRIEPAAAADNRAALLDAAFLTACTNLVYPFAGDVRADRASYIRFRIDRLPKTGIYLGGHITTYIIPFMGTGRFCANPSGLNLNETKRELHTAPGFTPWYGLQDLERMPGLTYGRALHFNIEINGRQEAPEGVAGATQFACYPYADAVVREIDWREPAGLYVTLLPDFDSYPDKLRTFRDQAREHYEQALRASEAQVLPLTRPVGLTLETGGGGPAGAVDYVVKTLRLLGFNDTDTPDPVAMRQRYGWASFSGNAGWPCRSLPFDEAQTRQAYLEYYRTLRDPAWREFNEGVPVFQMVDEPYEMLRNEMSSPLWRYEEGAGQAPRWVDYPGSSELHTRSTAYSNCVLEGVVQKIGALVEFRAAGDSSTNPARFAYWRIGTVLPDNNPATLLVGRRGLGEVAPEAFVNETAGAIGTNPVPFKLVYEADKAALYLRDVLISQQDRLPMSGGFGFAGDAKALSGLRFRRVAAGEHIIPPEQSAPGADKKTEEDDSLMNETLSLLEEDKERKPAWEKPKPLKEMVEQDWVVGGGLPEAHAGFRRWAAEQGATPALFGKTAWDAVSMITLTNLVRTAEDRRLFYWSRRYSGWLTPRMFALAMDGIRANAPNPAMRGYVGLSCGALVFSDGTPMDMFQLASYTNGLMPGISDWFAYSTESPQGDAFSAAFFNAGARREGQPPASISMMHCVRPSVFRTYTVLANNVRHISFYNFGPQFANGDNWSECVWCYDGSAQLNNRAAQADDLLAAGRMRPSRVALLYSMANEYWEHGSSFKDKRAAFLVLAHEYFQPELVNEDQVAAGVLKNYDALYVMDNVVAAPAQQRIEEWVKSGGLLWLCANAAMRNEFDEPHDLLARLVNARRTYELGAAATGANVAPLTVAPAAGQAEFRPHTVVRTDMPASVAWDGARVRAAYDDQRPAWLEGATGKGRVIYVAHRAGLTCGSRVIRYFRYRDWAEQNFWADTGRALLAAPLREADVARELILSEPLIMAAPVTASNGTVIVLYNMQPHPATNLEFRLREPAPPASVECFDGYRLKALEHQYQDGWVRGRLPPFDGGQMVVVRRQAAGADNRLAQMKERTLAQLASGDPTNLSAGAFFAGFFPEWKLANQLTPLLGHAEWFVRRQAAESLARLKEGAAAGALADALTRETDPHALGDELLALAELEPARARALVPNLATNRHWFVRRQALRTCMRLLDSAPTQSERELGLKLAGAALGENDLRVRGEGIKLLGRLDGRQTLEGAVASAAAQQNDLDLWAEALAANEEGFADYLKGNLPGGDNLLLALARVRRHPALATALAERLKQLRIDAQNAQGVVEALAFQQDRALARRVCLERAKLPASLTPHIAYILNFTFDVRLGSDLDDWEHWLKSQPE